MLDKETIDEALGSIGESIELIKYAIEISDSEEVKKNLKRAIDNLKETMNEIKGNHNIKCYSCGCIFTKPELKELYLFSWNKIPGNDDGRLIEFLMQNFNIKWVKGAKIKKNDDGKTIMVISETKFVSLALNDEKTKVNLKIDDGRNSEFTARIENSELNIYKKSTMCPRPTCKMPVIVEL